MLFGCEGSERGGGAFPVSRRRHIEYDAATHRMDRRVGSDDEAIAAQTRYGFFGSKLNIGCAARRERCSFVENSYTAKQLSRADMKTNSVAIL